MNDFCTIKFDRGWTRSVLKYDGGFNGVKSGRFKLFHWFLQSLLMKYTSQPAVLKMFDSWPTQTREQIQTTTQKYKVEICIHIWKINQNRKGLVGIIFGAFQSGTDEPDIFSNKINKGGVWVGMILLKFEKLSFDKYNSELRLIITAKFRWESHYQYSVSKFWRKTNIIRCVILNNSNNILKYFNI